MLLVDPRALDSIRQPSPLPNPISESLRELDQGMKNILDKGDFNVNDKANAYYQTLRKYLHRAEQYKHEPVATVSVKQPSGTKHAVVEEEKEGEEEEEKKEDSTKTKSDYVYREMLDYIPQSLRKKADQVLKRLKVHSKITWDDVGRVFYNNQLIPSANLLDLVSDLVRNRKKALRPAGWKTFSKAVHEINLPREYFGDYEKWRVGDFEDEMEKLSEAAGGNSGGSRSVSSSSSSTFESFESDHSRSADKRRKDSVSRFRSRSRGQTRLKPTKITNWKAV